MEITNNTTPAFLSKIPAASQSFFIISYTLLVISCGGQKYAATDKIGKIL
jgi:hypothetical protein